MWALIKALPQILSLLTTISDALQAGEREITVHIQLGKFDTGTDTAKDKKDTSGLEKLLHG